MCRTFKNSEVCPCSLALNKKCPLGCQSSVQLILDFCIKPHCNTSTLNLLDNVEMSYDILTQWTWAILKFQIVKCTRLDPKSLDKWQNVLEYFCTTNMNKSQFATREMSYPFFINPKSVKQMTKYARQMNMRPQT